MIGGPQYVGIGVLALAAIWGFLFVNPISPVKKCWWSALGKLTFMIDHDPGHGAKANNEYISVWVALVSWQGIMVDRLVLKIGRKRISSFDWKPHEVLEREYKFVDFERPDWLNMGVYEAQLIAYTHEGYSKSKMFMLEVS